MKIPQVIILVSIVLIKHHQFICLLLDVSPHNQLKKTIGEKVLPSTCSPKLKISCEVIVDIGSYINAISSKSLEYLGLEVVPHPTYSKCIGLTPRHLRSNNDVCPDQFQSLQR